MRVSADIQPLNLVIPVRPERLASGRPDVLGNVQTGQDGRKFNVGLFSGTIVDAAVDTLVEVGSGCVEGGCKPQLDVGIAGEFGRERRVVFLKEVEEELLLFFGAKDETGNVAEGCLEGVAEVGGEVVVGAGVGWGNCLGLGFGGFLEGGSDVGVGGLEEESGPGAGKENTFLEDLREDFELVEGFEMVGGHSGGLGGDRGDAV